MFSASADIPHPDYGLDHSTRLLVLQDAEVMGIRAAADAHRVSVASVYVWRKRYDFTAHHETKDH